MKHLIILIILFSSCSSNTHYFKYSSQYEYQKENRKAIYESEKFFSIKDWKSPITGKLVFKTTAQAPFKNEHIVEVVKGRVHNINFKGSYYELCITLNEVTKCDYGNPYFPTWYFNRSFSDRIFNRKHPFTKYINTILT